MVGDSADAIASIILSLYSSLRFKPPDGQFTILAGFILSDAQTSEVISMGTGSKCLPASRLPKNGDALHDSHAEILARRGAIRWFLEEITRTFSDDSEPSPWVERDNGGKHTLKRGVELSMYISTVPCGDASTRYLASFQDAQMAALKDATQYPAFPPNGTSRGRDNYSLYGVMRTKPGRADSPPTLSMSCSDKIATWNVLGIQGALASRLFQPIYIDRIVIGEVEPSMRVIIHEDCVRALYGRLRGISGLAIPFKLNIPSIEFTSLEFVHSRSALTPRPASGCNDSLCWIGNAVQSHEVLINGIRRGVPPKHRHNPKFRPILSKLSLYGLFHETAHKAGVPMDMIHTYYEAKRVDRGYETAKVALKGPGGLFKGWVTSGHEWETFDVNGTCLKEETGSACRGSRCCDGSYANHNCDHSPSDISTYHCHSPSTPERHIARSF